MAECGSPGGRRSEQVGNRESTRRGHLAPSVERLSPRGARHVVCKRSQAKAERQGFSRALCRRCGVGFFGRVRRTTGDGGAPQAFWELRPHPAPREDAAGAVSAAAHWSRRRSTRAGELRFAWLQSSLGAEQKGVLGHQTQYSQRSVQASPEANRGVVSSRNALANTGAAPEAIAEAERALRLLRVLRCVPTARSRCTEIVTARPILDSVPRAPYVGTRNSSASGRLCRREAEPSVGASDDAIALETGQCITEIVVVDAKRAAKLGARNGGTGLTKRVDDALANG